MRSYALGLCFVIMPMVSGCASQEKQRPVDVEVQTELGADWDGNSTDPTGFAFFAGYSSLRKHDKMVTVRLPANCDGVCVAKRLVKEWRRVYGKDAADFCSDESIAVIRGGDQAAVVDAILEVKILRSDPQNIEGGLTVRKRACPD